MKREKIASLIDHTILAPNAVKEDIIRLCREAEEYKFASVCVNPYYVPICTKELKNAPVKVCTVIGFPLGASTSQDKANEAVQAVLNGADELDMVINIGAALESHFDQVYSDICQVVHAVRKKESDAGKKIIIKVILETCFLDNLCIENCCRSTVKAGADFVKTSTGFASPKDKNGTALPNGASAKHVELMRSAVGKDFGVKASGGIRNAEAASKMIIAGANRIGTSSGIKIVDSWDESIDIPGWDI